MANDNLRVLTVTVDVDVSEALTGLKALQREAKEATKALREVESAQSDVVQINAIKAEKYDAIAQCFSRYSRDDIEYLKNGYDIFDVLDDQIGD